MTARMILQISLKDGKRQHLISDSPDIRCLGHEASPHLAMASSVRGREGGVIRCGERHFVETVPSKRMKQIKQ
jgi:hypothetical protein